MRERAAHRGYRGWVNTERRIAPSVPASSYCGFGAGNRFTWSKPEAPERGDRALVESSRRK
jgi:hypothetical protein